MIQLFDEKENCCGCTACMNICPQRAINMVADDEGFKYPEINQKLCIECKMCKKVCTFQNGYNTKNNLKEPLVYAAKHKKDEIRMSSSSGGTFTAISDYVLDEKGVVYGVQFDGYFNVIHGRASNKEDRDKFKGSKYVQSDLSDIFQIIKKDLNNSLLVLFTGTPCQCAGLKAYLTKCTVSMENLLLCDIVCHGTPSPLMWKEYLHFCETANKSKIINYEFRSKILGWHTHTEASTYLNGKVDYKSSLSQSEKSLFYSHNTLRIACHNCRYTNLQRISDITIADFWGIEKSIPDFDDNKGVSLIMVNTPKGQDLFGHIKPALKCCESDTKKCFQPQLQHPCKPSSKRDEFWKDYYTKGYPYIIKKYTDFGYKNALKKFMKKTLEKCHLLESVKKYIRKLQ